MIENIIR